MFIEFNNKLALTALHSAAWNQYWQGRCINRKWLSWDLKNYIFRKSDKDGVYNWPKIDYKGGRGSESPAAHTQQAPYPSTPRPGSRATPHEWDY